MKLQNEFTVAAPLERTWQTLLDIERVATCLPGARIEAADKDGGYRGSMTVRLGPMTVNYRGTARLEEVDEDNRTASIAVEAREAKGQGMAAAVIRNQVEPQNGGTRVLAETDLKITGRQAQFGRGILQDVANSMMAQFAERLEQQLNEPPSDESTAGLASQQVDGDGDSDLSAHRSGESAGRGEDDVLDLGGLLAGSGLARPALWAAALALFILIAWLRPRVRIRMDLGR